MRTEWAQTSCTISCLANCWGAKTKPSDFDPFEQNKPPVRADISVLRDLFVRDKKPKGA